MSLSSPKENGFVIQTVVAAHRDDDAQPDVAEHADGLGVLLASCSGSAVVGVGPGALLHAAKGELPERFAQGMDAGTPKADGAGGTAG